MPLNRPIHAITEEDLQNLVTEPEPESRYVDYKLALSLDNDETKAEFRRDVTSFANAIGGDIIVGIRENKKTKAPEELCGFDLGDQSEEQYKLRLQQILQSRVKPLLRGIAIRPLRLSSGMWAAIIRIPGSFAKPHQVEVGVNKPFEFWVRIDGGKQRMDIDELRDAILLSEGFADRARAFRQERIAALKRGITPVALTGGAKTILHFIPIEAFRSSHSYDFAPAELGMYATNQRSEWPRYYDRGFSFYNFDGIINSNRNFIEEQEIPGAFYVQFFRNGIVEAVETYRLDEENRTLPIENFQYTMLEAIQKFTLIMQRMGIQAPIAIMVSLSGVRGFCLQLDNLHTHDVQRAIDRDDLLIPDVLLTEYTFDANLIAQLARPIFDVLWQACNYRRCPNYDEEDTYSSARLTRDRLAKVFM